MPNLKGWELLILIAVLVLLFGAKKLPDAARGMGRSLRIFKAETKGLMDDETPAVDAAPAAGAVTAGTTADSTPAQQVAQPAQQPVAQAAPVQQAPVQQAPVQQAPVQQVAPSQPVAPAEQPAQGTNGTSS